MQSDLLSHALHREFPNLANAIARLKHSDAHFAHLLEQHDAVDADITKSLSVNNIYTEFHVSKSDERGR